MSEGDTHEQEFALHKLKFNHSSELIAWLYFDFLFWLNLEFQCDHKA